MFKNSSFLIFLFFLSFKIYPVHANIIRVLQEESVSSFLIHPQNVSFIEWANGEKIFLKRPLQLTCKKNMATPTFLAAVETSKQGPAKINEIFFQGRLEFWSWPSSYFSKKKTNSKNGKKNLGCHLIQVLSLEDYVAMVVAKEINQNWPLESLKAQAILARTYVLKKKEEALTKQPLPYDIKNSEFHQVNSDWRGLTLRTTLAAIETKGEVLWRKPNQIAEVFYSADCGGRTFLPEEIWGNISSIGEEKEEDKKGVECDSCQEYRPKTWSFKITLAEFLKFLKLPFLKGEIFSSSDFILDYVPASWTVFEVILAGKKYKVKKSDMRNFWGRNSILSHHFSLSRLRHDTLEIVGTGYGHGVGVCQTGVYQQGLQGKEYRDILAYYLPSFFLAPFPSPEL